jgi:hypothetical protein
MVVGGRVVMDTVAITAMVIIVSAATEIDA